MKTKENGITLIALVVTIIVLIILASISIASLTGDNGIINQANTAKIDTENSQVLENMRLKVLEYERNNINTVITDYLSLLKSDNIIDDNGIVNVTKLMGQDLDTGKGKNGKDVYVLEENILCYYEENGNRKELGNIWNEEVLEEADEDLFEITSDGTITLKYFDQYYYNEMDWTIETLVIPEKVDGITVRRIALCSHGIVNPPGYFESIKNLKEVILPSTVTVIDSMAFEGCVSLKNITMPDSLKIIEYEAFKNCTSLSTIEIPESVTSIGDSAFEECSSLTSITIPENVTSIGSDAFYECTSISTIEIPKSVADMGAWVFCNWNSSQTINIQFKQNEIPSGWDEYWNMGCNATIKYLDS